VKIGLMPPEENTISNRRRYCIFIPPLTTLFKLSATGFSYEGTGTAWVNGSGKGSFGTNITANIEPFGRPN
jgi:hypothetical protein